jgi:hypothetical protein
MNESLEIADVVRVGAEAHPSIVELVQRYGVKLLERAATETLPGSYWGQSEAGLLGNALYVRADTPLHSLLHELSHYVCMSPERRDGLNRDAGGDDAEECAVCYLQIVLSGELPMLGRARMLSDMDRWGYTFRLGTARAWFEHDAADACIWLRRNGVLDERNRPTFLLKQ